MKRERASVVCVHAERLLTVQLRDPQSQVARLFVPGGAVEPGETPEEAAIRETLEETGYRVRLLPSAPIVARYPFTWNGRHIDVTTHFFAATLRDPLARPAPVCDASYLEGTRWLALADVERELGFDANIQTAVLQLLAQRGTCGA